MAVANVIVRKQGEQAKPIRLSAGTRTEPSGGPIKNAILLSLPDAEFSALRPHLIQMDLPHHFLLHEAGSRLDYGYFIDEGMTSLVVTTKDGRSVEVGLVGREGMVGTALAFGFARAPSRAIAQIPGSGTRVRAEILEELLTGCSHLRDQLTRYSFVQGVQAAQVAACNRLHEIDQRLARWLLMCQDRVDSELLILTHEFLAQMLGTGRPSVSLAAGLLQRAGWIATIRGTIRVLNRKGLESAACECYGILQHFNGGLGLK
jgi:CRP-like cAMP-binding protein